MCHCSSIPGSPPAPRGLGSSRRGLFFSEKNTPLFVWDMHLVEFVICCRFQGPSSTPWSMSLPQAPFFLKKHPPGFWEHVSCGFCQYLGNLAVIRAGGTCSQGWGNLLAAPGGTSRGGNIPLPFKMLSKNPPRTSLVWKKYMLLHKWTP